MVILVIIITKHEIFRFAAVCSIKKKPVCNILSVIKMPERGSAVREDEANQGLLPEFP